MLAAPGQIVLGHPLAQREAETPLWRQARRFRPQRRQLVSVAGMRPAWCDLGGGAATEVRIGRGGSARTLDLPFPRASPTSRRASGRWRTASAPAGSGTRPPRIGHLKATAPPLGIDTSGRRRRAQRRRRRAGRPMDGACRLRQRRLRGDRVSLEQCWSGRPPSCCAALSQRPIFARAAGSPTRWPRAPSARYDTHRRPAVDLHGPGVDRRDRPAAARGGAMRAGP